MGVLAPGSAHARPSSQPPISTSGNFRRTCLQSHLQTSPPSPQKSYLKFQNPRTIFENPLPCPPTCVIARIFVVVGILIILLVRSPCKTSEPYDNPFYETIQSIYITCLFKNIKKNMIKHFTKHPIKLTDPQFLNIFTQVKLL